MLRLIGLLAVVTSAMLAVTEAAAQPFRGSVHWSVLLCKYSDSGQPPHGVDYYQDMIARPGTGGLADYWRDISMGNVDLGGVVVKGWYTEPMTVAQAKAKSGGPNPKRGDLIGDCVATARRASVDRYVTPPGNLIAVITFPEVDMYGEGGHTFLPDKVDLGGMAHEFGHGIGLDHSFSDDPTHQVASWERPGEYDDPWDVMSWARSYSGPAGRFGRPPPGLDGFHLDQMGWLPRSRIMTFGADRRTDGTVTLAPLGHLEVPGLQLVRIPSDAADHFHYYTVEYRRKTGWDSGIPGDVVLIHEINRLADGKYYSVLLRERSGDRPPRRSITANGVSISVASIAGDHATVEIHRRPPRDERSDPALTVYGPDACKGGYVWREADDFDVVCVSGAARDQAKADNAQTANRSAANGICRAPFVQRGAFLGDRVCVTPAVRAQTAEDNNAAHRRLGAP